MDLSTIGPKPGSRKNRKRIGRGNASGNGRTAGKGEKGQKARSGVSIRAGFEGGQMPLYRRIPKIGFRSLKQITGENQFLTVSTRNLEIFEDGAVIDEAALRDAGFKRRARHKAGVKILGGGNLSKKLTIRVNAITAGARKEIEAAGGSVELIEKKATSSASASE